LINVGIAVDDTTSADLASLGRAAALAKTLDLVLLSPGVSARDTEYLDAILFLSHGGTYLQQTGKKAPGPVMVEFGSSAMRHRRRAGQNEMLGRAVGVGKKNVLRVLDATAGLGKDSFILADLGCEVYLCERHPIVVELLASGLERAGLSREDWLSQVCGRMALCPGDARAQDVVAMAPIDVIYLDPMFPGRIKSANVKKEMALFQSLMDRREDVSDADDLLLWSLKQDVSRVVVKRPGKAPVLAARKPGHVIAGKTVRYDVYVLRAHS
jgi:16S rRNA (guanine1516-N2)-methyltransferase